MSELHFIILSSNSLNLLLSSYSKKSTSWITIKICMDSILLVNLLRLVSKSFWGLSSLEDVKSRSFERSTAAFCLNYSSTCMIPFLKTFLSSSSSATLLVISFFPMPEIPLTVTSLLLLMFSMILNISLFLNKTSLTSETPYLNTSSLLFSYSKYYSCKFSFGLRPVHSQLFQSKVFIRS